MLSTILRINIIAALLLFLSLGMYGQFRARCEHNTIRNSVAQAENERQFLHATATNLDESDDIADIDDNFDSFVKDFSFASATVFLLFILGPVTVSSLITRKHPPVHLRLLASHSFLQTYRV